MLWSHRIDFKALLPRTELSSHRNMALKEQKRQAAEFTQLETLSCKKGQGKGKLESHIRTSGTDTRYTLYDTPAFLQGVKYRIGGLGPVLGPVVLKFCTKLLFREGGMTRHLLWAVGYLARHRYLRLCCNVPMWDFFQQVSKVSYW